MLTFRNSWHSSLHRYPHLFIIVVVSTSYSDQTYFTVTMIPPSLHVYKPHITAILPSSCLKPTSPPPNNLTQPISSITQSTQPNKLHSYFLRPRKAKPGKGSNWTVRNTLQRRAPTHALCMEQPSFNPTRKKPLSSLPHQPQINKYESHDQFASPWVALAEDVDWEAMAFKACLLTRVYWTAEMLWNNCFAGGW